MLSRRPCLALIALATLSACGYKDAYEEAVYDLEPRYCYQQLGSVVCHDTPHHRDSARLVNYFGPHPDRYDQPEPRPRRESIAPKPVDYYSQDLEPIPDDSTVHPAN